MTASHNAGMPASRARALRPLAALLPYLARHRGRVAGALAARIVVEDEWAGGWCGRLEVSGPARGLRGTTATFTLPPGTSVDQSWNAELRGTSGRIEVGFPEWARTETGAPYTATGFCVRGRGRPGTVAIS